MPPVILTGALGAGLEALERMLSESAYLQSWCGHPGNPTLTLEHIDIISSENQFNETPHVYIDYGDDFAWESDAQTLGNSFPPGPDGSYMVQFIDQPDKVTYPSVREQRKKFTQDQNQVLIQLASKFGQGGELAISRIAPATRIVVTSVEQGEMDLLWRKWDLRI